MALGHSVQHGHRVSAVCAHISGLAVRLTQIVSAAMLDEARRWFEASTVICRFVPEGKQRAEKVRVEFYSKRSCRFYQ